MDHPPSSLWLAEASRFMSNARALAERGQSCDLAEVRRLNAALESRLMDLASPPDIDLMDYFQFSPVQAYAGATPFSDSSQGLGLRPTAPDAASPTGPVRRVPYTTWLNTTARSVPMVRQKDLPPTSPPVRFDTPLTISSPISPRSAASDLSWRVGEEQAAELDIAICAEEIGLTQEGSRVLAAIWAVGLGASITGAARRHGIPKTRLNACLRELAQDGPAALARRMCQAQSP